MAETRTATRAAVIPLLILNFCMYMIVLGIAGWAINRAIDFGQTNVVNPTRGVVTVTRYPVGNAATPYFIITALIAGVVGIASLLTGAAHIALWRSESLAAAASSALIAWLLTLLAFGLSCKEIRLRGGYRDGRMKTLEAFVIILAGFQLLYLLLLHGGLLGDDLRSGGREGAEQYPKTAAAAPAV
ncbi:hypothetical protein O6H91_07G019500 [Diphasiastrum complanatum]|uniref:Uncharacterized protein n=1 Tax=Diphasiastrum complanatum TaxID=34168 RepID=A0ACC2D3A9_DIPCM|nr:hypothetical protein O6H91_07G019500 [Diphasiastrum complanatum]